MFAIIREIAKALGAGKKPKLSPETVLKLYYGCGTTRQPGHINVHVRKTKATDRVAELGPLARCLQGCCSEVYMSHVLEHFGSQNSGTHIRRAGIS